VRKLAKREEERKKGVERESVSVNLGKKKRKSEREGGERGV